MAIDTPKREVEVSTEETANVEKRKQFHEYDEAPADIDEHAFEPIGAWYTRCKHCGLAMAAHAETTVNPRDHIGFYGDDDD